MARQTLTIDVDGQTFRLEFGMNALVAAEDKVGTSFGHLMRGASEGRLGAIRAICWGALQTHHPQMSLTDVGDWMQRIGLDRLNDVLSALSGTIENSAHAHTLKVEGAPLREMKDGPRAARHRQARA